MKKTLKELFSCDGHKLEYTEDEGLCYDGTPLPTEGIRRLPIIIQKKYHKLKYENSEEWVFDSNTPKQGKI